MKTRTVRCIVWAVLASTVTFLMAGNVFGQTLFKTEQITVGAVNHRAPGINNSGEIVWMEETAQDWQIMSSTRGQLTSPGGSYGPAEYPSLADDGSFVCFRAFGIFGNIVRYPGGGVYESSTSNPASGSRRNPVRQSGISSNGRVIWGREFYQFGSLSTRKFFLDGTEVSLPSTLVNWQNPSVNRNADFVYDNSGTVYVRFNGDLSSTIVTSGTQPYINDNRDIAYVSGSQVKVLYHDGQLRTVGTGTDPAINADGIVVFERQVDGFYQIFRARPAMTTLHRLETGLVFGPSDGVDQLLDVQPNPSVLENQPRIGAGTVTNFGLVADGVTPLLIKVFLVSAPTPGTTFDLDLSVVSGGSITSGNLNQRLRVLGTSAFSAGTILTPTADTAFAFLSGIRTEDVSLNAGSKELTVQLTVRGPSLDLTNTFKIRKPPIVLVHGYNTKADTWSDGFLNVLKAVRPDDFVIPIQYGVVGSNPKYYPNTYERLDDLSKRLDSVLRAQIDPPSASSRAQWAMTRYDVIGHSQGGVLLRMLCSTTGKFGSSPSMAFRHDQNFHRGRFRRIVTVGSPHNGAIPLYYANAIFQSGTGGKYRFVPSLLKDVGLLQLKFDPWGDQIRQINDPLLAAIDENAKFHTIATTIGNSGPVPLYNLVGLWYSPRKAATIPEGSDGVVDFRSQVGGLGTIGTSLSGNIAHAPFKKSIASIPIPPDDLLTIDLNLTKYLFRIPSADDTQTRSGAVASQVIAKLDGIASEFGRFFAPTLLSATQKSAIDGLLPVSYDADLVNPSLIQSAQYNFQLSPLQTEPVEGDVVWTAEVFGTNGVSTVGIGVQPSTNDSTHVTVTVEDNVVGDVVLYASYTSTNGNVVFAHPVLVVSRPVGGTLTNIAIMPSALAMGVGAAVEPEIWGMYSSGVQSRLYIPINQAAQFSSSNTNVAQIAPDGLVTATGLGVTTLTASFNNFTNHSFISVLPSGGQPLLRSPSLQGTDFVFELLGQPGGNYRIDASTNLTTWSTLTNVITTNGLWQFINPLGTNATQRFFRAVNQ